MMNKIKSIFDGKVKFLLLFGLVTIIISTMLRYFQQKTTPSFFGQSIEILEKDRRLIEVIGRFDTYKYSWDNEMLLQDTVNFEIEYIGKKGSILVKGKALKDSVQDNWKLIKLDYPLDSIDKPPL